MAYFENPVVAPVKVVANEKVEVKIEEKEEKKEEESKSIWSNFKEVLKRPPREKVAKVVVEEEKKEEDDVGPMRLTMFDLIKPKSISK